MKQWDSFIKRQGLFLLENEIYAIICTAVFALFPLVLWLAAAVVCFITLRQGWIKGLRVLILGLIPVFIIAVITNSFSSVLISVAVNFLPCYFAACFLRLSLNFNNTVTLLLVEALLAIVFIQLCWPQLITDQYQTIITVLKSYDTNLVEKLFHNTPSKSVITISSYFFGIQVLTVWLSTATSLITARSLQAKIFNPGGFKDELLNVKGLNYVVLLLFFAIWGAFLNSSLAISCLPVLLIYFFLAGLSLISCYLIKIKNILAGIIIFLSIIIVPVVLLPSIVILGCLDSFINIRQFFSTKIDTEKR